MVVAKEKLRAARALLGWSQEELAERASVGVGTVKRLEKGVEAREGSGGKRKVSLLIENAIVAALVDAGIVLDPSPEDLADGSVEACVALRRR